MNIRIFKNCKNFLPGLEPVAARHTNNNNGVYKHKSQVKKNIEKRHIAAVLHEKGEGKRKVLTV
jgi:hypothetical protein